MYRFKRKNKKIKAILMIFSMGMTILFMGMFFLIFNFNKNLNTTNSQLYNISAGQYIEMMKSDGTIKVNPSQLMTTINYNKSILQSSYFKLIPFFVLFLFLIFVLISLFWTILKKIQKKEIEEMIHNLDDVSKPVVVLDDELLNSLYLLIQEKFTDHLNDYKRLNSYLSHDQKNAITIMRTNLEFSGHQEYLKNLDFISDSIDNVLTLSETNDSLPLDTVDVGLVCAEVCDAYQNVDNQISFSFDESAYTEILAKKRWIYRSIANVIDNAIKYGNHKPIEVFVTSKNNTVLVRVKDYGIGMSVEKQGIIFEHFTRINELKENGYGIGLSLVSHVSDLCGGFVAVDSEIGQGSTFYLSFPQK